MKLVTIEAREVEGRPGLLLDAGQVLDLTAAPASLEESQWIPQSTISILAAGERGLELARSLANQADTQPAQLEERGALSSLEGTALMVPVRRVGLVLITESRPDGKVSSYIKSPNAAVGHAAEVEVPSQTELHATPMLAAVLGKPLSQADSARVESAVSAWTLTVELGPQAGDVETATQLQDFLSARQFHGSLPMGPALITADELADPASVTSTLTINGADVWQGALGPSRVDCIERLSALTRDYAFAPGDIIAFSSADRPRQRLHAGDRVAFRADGFMELSFSLGR